MRGVGAWLLKLAFSGLSASTGRRSQFGNFGNLPGKPPMLFRELAQSSIPAYAMDPPRGTGLDNYDSSAC